MTGRLDGSVALVSGAARGLGRSHALRLAEEGADIIAFDAAAPVPAQGAPPATPEDLAETARLVAALGRRVVATRADTRDAAAVRRLVDDGVAELGGLDVVVANAGVAGIPASLADSSPADWQAVIDSDVIGVYNTLRPAIPHLVAGGAGGSIAIISSSVALRLVPNLSAYGTAKAGLIGLMKALALELAPHWIRVNTIHPSTVPTPMLVNDGNFRMFRPDLADPTLADVEPIFRSLNALPVPWVEEVDVSNAVVFLASAEARYITGVALPVDAGYAIK